MPKNNSKTQKKQKTNLRGSAPSAATIAAAVKAAMPVAKQNKTKPQHKSSASTTVVAAPVTIGTTVRGQGQSISHGKDSVLISGRDYVCAVAETNQTNWFMGALIPINPMFFSNSTLGRLGQSYRYFRFKRLTAHYVTRQPTSSTGQIILVQHPNASKELYKSAATSFLPIVMSSKTSMMGPVWTNHSLPLKVNSSFMEVDALSNQDIDDNINGELVAYVQSAITDTVGYVLFDYVIEFKEMYINEQSSQIPLSVVFDQSRSDDAANMVLNAQMYTLCPSALSSFAQGTVFKAVLNSTGTVYAAGATASTALFVVNRVNNGAITLQDGTTFYCVVVGTGLHWYPTMESAANQSDSVYISYALSLAARSQWYFTYWVAQWGNITKT